jgi:hypothetical protein
MGRLNLQVLGGGRLGSYLLKATFPVPRMYEPLYLAHVTVEGARCRVVELASIALGRTRAVESIEQGAEPTTR